MTYGTDSLPPKLPASSAVPVNGGMSGKQYCCVTNCHNFQGKYLTDEDCKITLHRFPSGVAPEKKKLRRIWEFRLSRKHFEVKSSTRICCKHFVGGRGPTKEHQIPSIFPHKTFKTSSDKFDCQNCHHLPDCGAVETEDLVVAADARDQTAATDGECNVFFSHSASTSNLDVSVALHDYVGQVDIESLPTFRHKQVQHQADACNSASQTESSHAPSTCSKLIQTDLQPRTRSVHVQTDVVPELTIHDIKEKDMMFYTGIPDKGTFNVLFDQLTSDSEKEDSGISAGGRPKKLNPIDEFFMVLMRLRLGLLEFDLAKRFRVSQATISNVFNTWIDKMYLKLSFLVCWTPRHVVQANMPKSFKERYPSTRVIIDCTEIFTESPTSLINKSLVYSDYKSHNTWKVLVGISPSGTITYISDLWGGNTSDKQIVARSSLLDLCDKGDAIMADKGFQIQDMLIPRGIYLIIPPKKKPNKKFNSREVEATRRIANLRIHVERAMERIKNFRILQGVVPLSMSEKIDKIFKVSCYLCNLQPQLIKK